MRIIGQIEHPNFKISVFRADNRISVKFENEGYEQTFKFGTDERIDGVEAVRQWADAILLEAVLDMMRQMHGHSMYAFNRAFPPHSGDVFETII